MGETIGTVGITGAIGLLLIVGGIPGSATGFGTELGTTIGVEFQEGAVGGAGTVRGMLTFGNTTGRTGGLWAVAPPLDTVTTTIRIANPIVNQRFERVDIKIGEWRSGNETQTMKHRR